METLVQSLGLEDPLEEGMATHSIILAWSWCMPGLGTWFCFFLSYWLRSCLCGLASGWLSGKESICQCWRCRFDTSVGKIPWRRAWQPTLVFLPGESPRTEEPGGLQSMWMWRVRHDWVTEHMVFWGKSQNLVSFLNFRKFNNPNCTESLIKIKFLHQFLWKLFKLL